MAQSSATPSDPRTELIRLFEEDEWRITNRADADGREALKSVMQFPTQCAIVDCVLDLLRDPHQPMHEIPRGEPPGSLGIGWVMNVSNEDFQDLYIELVIESNKAWVISFHPSKHTKKR